MATWRRISVIQFQDNGIERFIKSVNPLYTEWWGNLNYMLESDTLVLNIIGGSNKDNKKLTISINIRKKQPTTRFKDVTGVPQESIERVANKSKSRFRKWVREHTQESVIECDGCSNDIQTKKMTGCKNCGTDLCEGCAQPICSVCGSEMKLYPVWWKKLHYVSIHEDLPDDVLASSKFSNIYK